MKKRVPLGQKSYEKLKTGNYYVVDKSLMIKDYLDKGNEVTLITRPRRFGKTINMSMMAEFFDITKDSKELFRDTKIMKTECASEMNQYPTIFLSFADVKGNKQMMINNIQQILAELYQKNNDVFKDLDEYDLPFFENIKRNFSMPDKTDLNGLDNALSFLMKQMERYYRKKVMIFIDEYDTPFIEAHINGFYNEIRENLSSMLHQALKSSNSLQYAMLTGIQRVAKENLFSDLNNLVVCTVADENYSQYFGFTESEVSELLEYYDLELNDTVKIMYNGYHFGNTQIYNPWSVLNYAATGKDNPYWLYTSSNKMIREAMRIRNQSFDRDYEKLVQTGYLETTMYLETSFFEISEIENLWGLFVNAGYLTIEKTVDRQNNLYVLKIPNQEVQQEFRNLTAYYLDVKETDFNGLFNALRLEKKEDFKDRYQNMLLILPSYHDLKDENSYHVLFLGMCAWLKNDYKIISNREEGKGRCDIILQAKDENKTSFVLEFKYIGSDSEASQEKLQTAAKQAVEQIRERQYDIEIDGKVVYIGLAHHGKDAAIEWQEK
ncbi:AAA family ATPase [Massilicoli timonensis]|uniref:AAA family ATPase n=1 Tax=Massilicoli timonensis TaxID=2015901 RepID=UPI000C81E34E|nr:AAA family ATPase [Massilicoli timonensis]